MVAITVTIPQTTPLICPRSCRAIPHKGALSFWPPLCKGRWCGVATLEGLYSKYVNSTTSISKYKNRRRLFQKDTCGIQIVFWKDSLCICGFCRFFFCRKRFFNAYFTHSRWICQARWTKTGSPGMYLSGTIPCRCRWKRRSFVCSTEAPPADLPVRLL